MGTVCAFRQQFFPSGCELGADFGAINTIEIHCLFRENRQTRWRHIREATPNKQAHSGDISIEHPNDPGLQGRHEGGMIGENAKFAVCARCDDVVHFPGEDLPTR
jgi:hypothetical protein